jgi:predicted ATPase/class 3 adenylate cyclase
MDETERMAGGGGVTDGVPSGIVAFLFTDIEGSTALWSDDADGMARSLELHDRIVRRALEARGGYVFATGGDGFAVAFARSSDAVTAAFGAQSALDAAKWPGPRLRVRMGLHVGEAQERDGDYLGRTVAIAARVMAAGHGGQILATESAAIASGAEPMARLGRHRLAGIAGDVELVQLGAGNFPPLRVESSPIIALPAVRSALIGQGTFLAEVRPRVEAGALVTLTVVGGCGKTRLAIELAARAADRFPGGVWFVDLSQVAEPEGLTGAVAATLGLVPIPTTPVIDLLASYLAARTALMVLDNCEHLLEKVAEFVGVLLDAAPDLAVLATSREQLEIEGEQVFRVPSLSVGSGSSGVALFLDRATSAGAVGLHDELDDIVAICEALDGLPLAIELAATRMRSMSAPELRSRLDDRFSLLGGRRRARQRQQTLEAAVQWSYDLCNEAEQHMLRHLSVFHGGFGPADAAYVAGVPETQAMHLIDSLVAKSLVDVIRRPGGARRRLLETIRIFASARLAAADEAAGALDRHLDRFRHDPAITDFGLNMDIAGRVRIADESANFRAAAAWALQRQRPADAAVIAAGLMDQFSNWGEIPLALDWLSAEPPDVAEAVYVRAAEGHLRYVSFDIDGVQASVDRAVELAAGEPVDALPWVLANNRSLVRMARGEVASIWGGIDEARRIAKRTPSAPRNSGFVEFIDACWALGLLDPERCIASAERSRSLFPDHGGGALCDAYKVAALLSLGRVDDAASAVRAMRPLAPLSPYAHVPTIVEILVSAAEVGPDDAARALAAAAPEPLARQPLTAGDWLLAFAWLACERGDVARARRLVVDTKHHSFAFAEVWRRALGWPGDGRASLQRWTAENPWNELIARAMTTQPGLIDEELRRWASTTG